MSARAAKLKSSLSTQNAPAYLEKYGPKTLLNGYEIIPIKPGTKRPPFGKWEDIRADKVKLKRWLEDGRASHGVGILARKTPMVDIDCRDDEIVEDMIAFTQKLLGKTVQRIGFAPKTGLLYRTDKPWPKVNSATFIDPDDHSDKPLTHKLEVLGDGQQFVAYAIHPDTKEPYRWIGKKGPHDTAWEDLPEIKRSDALEIAAHFETLMLAAGYERKKSLNRRDRDLDPDDVDEEFGGTAEESSRVDVTTQELSLKLALVPGAEDYDTWFQIGMALHHQYGGEEEGLILWHEWSAQASNYDLDVLDEKWPTLDIEGKGRAPVTARLIIKLANEEEKRIAGEQVEDTREEIKAARSVERLREAAEKVKRIAFEPIVREGIVALVRKQYKDITGEVLTTPMARQLVRYENPDNKRHPKWLEGFVYIAKDEVFYHKESRIELTAKAFDAQYNRYMMSQKDRLEGRSYPEHTASHAALNLWEIETVYRRMYMPHEAEFFTYNGQRFVNFYTEVGIPDIPESFSGEEKAAIRLVLAHLKHLFFYESAWKLLLDWLAYVVQTRRRVSWMPLIQGTEGDGKTFFAKMLKAVMGWENVAIVPGEALEERYNQFMEGALLVFFEEVRLHGSNRFEAVNRMKTWITNDSISIRAMHRGSYEIVNTASIMAATNHKDAIPAGANDTRYYPLYSRWQTKDRLEEFNEENPTYYEDLYATLKHAGALRKWLLEYPISPHFNPQGRAPESPYRDEMVALSETDLDTAFSEALNGSTRLEFCDMLLESALLDDVFEARGLEAPQGRARNIFLTRHGFSKFVKKLTIAGKTRSYWTREPENFVEKEGGPTLRNLVLNWMDPDQI